MEINCQTQRRLNALTPATTSTGEQRNLAPPPRREVGLSGRGTCAACLWWLIIFKQRAVACHWHGLILLEELLTLLPDTPVLRIQPAKGSCNAWLWQVIFTCVIFSRAHAPRSCALWRLLGSRQDTARTTDSPAGVCQLYSSLNSFVRATPGHLGCTYKSWLLHFFNKDCVGSNSCQMICSTSAFSKDVG